MTSTTGAPSTGRHDLIAPVLPNRPLTSLQEPDTFGEIALRRNPSLDFVENCAFDAGLITYDRRYQNSQAFSARFKHHMNDVASMLRRRFRRGSTAVEVGCGKGDFFALLAAGGHFEAAGYDASYDGSDMRIHQRFLNENDRLHADLIVLRHVLEHIPQPHRFLQLLKTVFGRAKIYIEVPDLAWILRNQVFVDITYEHVNYFSRAALSGLFQGGQIESGNVFDEQYQYVIADIADVSPSFAGEYESDRWVALDFRELFPRFIETIDEIDARLGSGRKAYIWGAATKGCMFLVHCIGLGKIVDKVAFAIDLNPNKTGQYLPVSKVPIKGKAEFYASASPHDLLIIANPSYQEEIIAELAGTHLKGMEFITL